MTDGNSIDSAPDAQAVNLGDTVTVGEALEIKFDKAGWFNELKPSDTSSVYSFMEGNPGEEYFAISGTVKNISADAIDVETGTYKFVFNDKYNYDGYIAVEGPEKNDFYGESLNPLKSSKFYIYTSVPEELKSEFERCVANLDFSAIADADSVYAITITK